MTDVIVTIPRAARARPAVDAFSPEGVAAGYADTLGLHVFPVDPESKRPHRMLGERGGLHHATRDPDVIARWWREDPRAGIGVNLGASRLAAFDMEGPRKGFDPAACRDAILAAAGPDALPATWETVTPSGGRHILYRVPADAQVSGGKLPVDAPGLDNLRTGGLYIVLPSVVPDPRDPDYRDEVGRRWVAFPDREPAPLPSWVMAARAPTRPPEPMRPVHLDHGEDASRYAATCLRGMAEDITAAQVGTRHSEVVRCWRHCLTLISDGEVTRDVAVAVILAAARHVGLPDDETEGIIGWGGEVAA